MKKIALFGGSFNPPHPGHFEMAKYIYETLGVDEVWFLFSINWQKDASQYATTAHRMEMGRILARNYPNLPFVMSGLQEQLKTHKTFEVLEALKERNSEHQFIWVMGADNLASFHTWEHWEDILQNYLVAVVDRPSYTEKAKQSTAALRFEFLRVASPRDLSSRQNGWCFLDNPTIDLSSRGLLSQLRAGQTQFDPAFQGVANYIQQHELYGVSVRSAPTHELKKE